ncbi:MAG: rod shape-determining protein MreC [Oscillospiraceae bacterium]|nr:rod shape-determining protein MreC [Oscillospiraceae bacterium]
MIFYPNKHRRELRKLKDFIKSVRFKILLCVFALLFGLMLHAAMSAGIANLPETALRTITRPFSFAATSISNWVGGTLDKIINANQYKAENDELRRRLSEMYAQLMDKEAIIDENAHLHEMLGIIAEREDLTLSLPAAVIAREAMSVSGNFTINRGSNHGIKTNDPVITSVGLIGIISETAPTYSRVRTVLSTEINIGVKTTPGGIVGIIENDFLYSADRKCLMRYIQTDSGMKIGDIVVTSGGSMYPPGLIVGTVTEIFPDISGLSLHAVIEPTEDVLRVADVFVITSFEGQGVTP